MVPRKKSYKSAVKYRNTLKWAAGIPAVASLIGSWGATQYDPSTIIFILLILTSAWATISHQASGLVRGRVLNPTFWSLIYIALAVISPNRWPLIMGVLIGITTCLLILVWVTTYPRIEIAAGDRFYVLHHPFEILVPLAYLAPQPLSPIFEPVVALHWSPVMFGIPLMRISLFEPHSLHNYISSRAAELSPRRLDWNASLTRFRKALGLLSLLDSLRRAELEDLDGVALAAAARLAIANFPETAMETLRDALMAFTPVKRRFILDAYDLEPSPV